ncbi:hypothetical protein FZW96_12050 [Bacillus sp. BGMRC 2118]|nr:hypothetical protein FZW96_12050 [Bacillus sp. BGMRC 2118]
MNEKSKEKMREQKTLIVEGLTNHFETIPLFEDEMAEDEEKVFVDSKYHLMVLQMGEFIPTSNTGGLTQTFTIDYYSEERDDVDEMLVDIITIVGKVPTVEFVRTNKLRARVGDIDRFIDVVTLEFKRMVKYESRT